MNEKVGITVSIAGDQEALASLRELATLVTTIKQNRKLNISVNRVGRDLASAKRQLDNLTNKTNKIKIDADVQRAQAAAERFRNQVQSRPVRLTFAMGKIGAGMLSVANTASKLLNNSLSNVTRNIGATVTSQFTSSIFSGIGKTVERFDTFKTYEQQMQQMGASSKDANNSITRLNDSVLGLPTALNDIIAVQKQFYSMTGDVNKATDLAIASNNAFLASGADQQQRERGMKQIKNMLATGELTSKQWLSLVNSMPGAIREMGKHAKLSGGDLNRWVKDVTAGKRPVKEFLQLLQEAGTKGNLVDLAAISKQTLSGWQSNLQTAVAGFGTKILQALDETLGKTQGEGLVSHLYKITDAIKALGDKAAEWIRKHPEEITKWLDRIKNFDWEGLGKGMMNAAKLFSNFIGFLSKVPGIAPALGFMMAGGGNAIMQGIYPIAGLFKAIGQLGDIRAAAEKSKQAGKAVEAMGEAFGGKGAKSGISKLGTGLANMSKATKVLGTAALGGGVVLEFIGVAALAAKAFKYIADINLPLGKLMGNIGKISLAIGALTGLFTAIGFLMTSTPVGWVATASALIGGGVSAGIVGLFANIGKMMDSITRVKVPNYEKIRKILSAAKKVFDEMSKIGTDSWSVFLPGGALSKLVSAWTNSKTVEMYVKAFTNVGKMLSGMKGIKVGDTIDTKGITNAVKAVQKIVEDITHDKSLLHGIVESWKTSNMAKTFKSLTGIVKGIGGLGDSVKKLQNADFTKDIDINKISNKIGEALAIVSSIADVIREKAPRFFGGVAGSGISETKIENGELEAFQKKIQNVVNIITTLANMTGTFKTLETAYQQMKKDFGGKKWSEISAVIKARIDGISDFINNTFGSSSETGSKLKTATSSLQDVDMSVINGAIKGISGTINALIGLQTTIGSAQGLFKTDKSGSSGLDSVLGTVRRIVNGITGIAKDIGDPDELREKMFAVRKAIASLTFAMGNIVNIGKIKVDISAVFDKISDVVSQLNTIGDTIKDPEGLREKMYAVRQSMASLVYAVQNVVKIPELLEGVSITDIGAEISGLITSLNIALSNAPDLLTNSIGFKTSAENLAGAFNQIASGDGSSIENFVNYLGKIPGAISKVNQAMKNRGNTWKNQLVGGFRNTATLILNVIRDLPTQITAITGFYTAGQSHGQNYKSGFEAGANGITLPNGSSLTTSTETRTRTSGFNSRGNPTRVFATGGEVHGPGGIDNVPAMLTNGEYVQRTSAVKAFGKDFMAKVNNLDMHGALTSLTARLGAKVMGGTTIHNHNNQQVIQHIHTNNENWSFMRANRFVRGLS